MSKWFTCAPVRYKGDQYFFWRDSGLLSKGLQRLGHESSVIMPGPSFEEDLPGILRAEMAQLRSSDWWRSLKLDGVIMVAWGRHQDTPISKAIHDSGTTFVLHVDGSCNHYPIFSRVEGIKTFWRAEHDLPGGPSRRLFSFFKYAIGSGLSATAKHSYLKYRHLRFPTLVTCQTPTSLDRNSRLCALFGGKKHGVNLKLAGYPTSGEFIWDPSVAKQPRVMAVGRWDDLRQKRPFVLMAACEELARRETGVIVDIFGTRTPAMDQWHLALPPELKKRILIHGRQPVKTIADAMRAGQISFFPSANEGGPQALFEGLRCGVTTVGLDSPFLPGTRWAAEQGHGDLATHDSTEHHVAALQAALRKWKEGTYNPEIISSYWRQWTDVDQVLRRMIEAATALKHSN